MTTKERLNESLIFSNLIKSLTIFRLWSHGTAVAAILIVMLQHTQMTSIKRSEFIFQLSLFSWSGKVVCRKMFSCKLAFYQIRKKKQEIVWELPLCLSHNLGSWARFDFSSYSCLYQANKTVVKYHVLWWHELKTNVKTRNAFACKQKKDWEDVLKFYLFERLLVLIHINETGSLL